MSEVINTDLAWSPPPCCESPYIGQYLTALGITSISTSLELNHH